jgi:hypothetical protein
MSRIGRDAGDEAVGSFQQFLEEQATKVQSEKSKGLAKRHQWIESVERLKDRMKGWLGEIDPGKLLTPDESPTVWLNEVGLGRYQITGLTIWFGLREVRLEPVARNVPGSVATRGPIEIPRAFGRVDLTNGLDKYLIFRNAVEPEDRWLILDEERHEARPFDRQSFEDAMRDLLG